MRLNGCTNAEELIWLNTSYCGDVAVEVFCYCSCINADSS